MFGNFLEFERGEKKAKTKIQNPSRCWEDKGGEEDRKSEVLSQGQQQKSASNRVRESSKKQTSSRISMLRMWAGIGKGGGEKKKKVILFELELRKSGQAWQ